MPQTDKNLRSLLHRLDGKSYPAYKDLTGSYQFDRDQTGRFTLVIDHVQGDPFAAPSRLRASVPMVVARFEADLMKPRSRLIALRDFLARSFALACQQYAQRDRGSGKSGLIAMALPGQEILERTAIIVTADYVEARFVCGLPAKGRRILGRQAAAMLCEDIPEIVSAALCHQNLNTLRLKQHLDTAEDADFLRHQLTTLGLVAFVADGAVLPRRSGVDHRPLNAEKAVPFRSPDSLRVTVNLPHAGQITGMGLPKGVTLIIGGGYHGKSTLLAALEQGVYTHIPSDGRHQTVTQVSAVKIRAEDGRRVEGVDLRPFINNLPDGQNTATFRTDNASGSTSQAANIMEALEIESQLLLLDEDTCATNLMIRDVRMQTLVERSGEPITPFLDRVRQLADEKDISSILVLGGSGDYFDVADTVIRMDAYRAYEVTTEAKSIAAQYPTGRQIENDDANKEYVTQALQAGANGYIIKQSDTGEVVAAIRAVSAGGAYLSPRVSKYLIEDYLNQPNDVPNLPDLTTREREVVQLIAEGLTTRDIAATLHISVKTVETHRVNIMKKLNTKSQADIVKYAIKKGLVLLD